MTTYHHLTNDFLNNRSTTFQKCVDATISLANTNRLFERSHHAASIIYKNRIITVGVNQMKTHPLQARFAKREEAVYLHAEVDAIVSAINLHGTTFLSGCDIIITRVHKNGQPALSYPCSGCKRAIEAFNIRRVYYT